MSPHALRLAPLAAILAAAAFLAGAATAAAGEALPLPEGFVEIADPASGTAEVVDDETSAVDRHTDRRAARSMTAGSAEAAARTGEGPEAVAAVPGAGTGAPAASRLLRSLEKRAAQPGAAPPPPSTDGTSADGGQTAAGAVIGGVPGSSPMPGSSPVPGSSSVLHDCPRVLLGALLASAADSGDAVSALAIERETLALCRERQEIVNGIVALEGELQALLAEAQEETGAPGTTAGAVVSAEAPIIKVSAPVRVIEMPVPAPVTAETDTPPASEPPSYSWFSILGTAGDLRAGVSGGARGGTRVWFVREGDRLPGGVTVTRIVARPPGVHVEGAAHAAFPYRPRHADNADPRGDAEGSGNTPSGGSTAGDGS